MNKREKDAKEKLRNHEAVHAVDHVAVVTKRGARLEYNQGQAVKQKRGQGLVDITKFLKGK